jgi:hypothetical protein
LIKSSLYYFAIIVSSILIYMSTMIVWYFTGLGSIPAIITGILVFFITNIIVRKVPIGNNYTTLTKSFIRVLFDSIMTLQVMSVGYLVLNTNPILFFVLNIFAFILKIIIIIYVYKSKKEHNKSDDKVIILNTIKAIIIYSIECFLLVIPICVVDASIIYTYSSVLIITGWLVQILNWILIDLLLPKTNCVVEELSFYIINFITSLPFYTGALLTYISYAILALTFL